METYSNLPILVIEDDDDIREALEDCLCEEGYEVRSAFNGQAALELLRLGLKPSLIICDLLMPVVCGTKFRDEQLSHEQWSNIPFVLLTATSDAKKISPELAPDMLLTKPLHLNDLLSAIKKLTGESLAQS